MRILFSFFFLSIFSIATAQFSGEPEQFLKDVNKYLKSYNPQKTKEFMDAFEPNWLTNFTSDYQSKVVSTANLIVSKNLPAFPNLYGYLLSAHSFVLTNQPAESFESWHQTIDALLNSKKVKKFEDFITVCSGFFSDGTIYYSNNYIWQFKGGSYNFSFDKNNPKIDFSGGNLYCYNVNRNAERKEDPYFDSTIVRNTGGTYEPFIHKWTGRGGIVDWQKVGMDPKKNYAEITDYSMSLKSNKIESDSVTMHTIYYDEPILGKFTDVCRKSDREVDRIYPSFLSFSKKIVRKSILEEVDYVGGFAISGADFNGVGFNDQPAGVIFYKQGEPFVKAYAPNFKINEKGIRANECRITMYLEDNDTIFHPGLSIYYDLNSLNLMRSNEGLAQAPFLNSYHSMEMYVEEILWVKDDPNLHLNWHMNQASGKVARFESINYFSERVYNQIQGINKTHPLVSLYQYSYKYDQLTIPIGNAASAMGFTKEQAVPILLAIANQGFLTYNSAEQTITLQPKTKKYIDARAGKIDYDNIVVYANKELIELKPEQDADGRTIHSNVSYNERAKTINDRKKTATEYGTLNLTTKDLRLNLVEPVEISIAQNVVIFPDDGELQVNKGLDFLFAGAVMAGKLEAYVSEGSFDYSSFRINLIETDAVLFRVKPIYGGGNGLIPMESHFEGIKGYIAIDDTTNRAGRDVKESAHYPLIKTSKDSYVFYDHPSIYNGVYDSARFYFKVDQFEFDSLDNFNEATMAFDGEMRSAGIFPVFKEKLRVQEDYSFGFKTIAPEGGFDFYGDNAKFDNEIKLSNEGLRGAGEIAFVNSLSTSENFIFFPDSTMGVSKYVNKAQEKSEGNEFPAVTGDGVMVTYVPKSDILKVRTLRTPLIFFDNQASLFGLTKLTPEKMTGSGLMYMEAAELGSRKFTYGHHVIDSDTADFNLADLNATGNNAEKNPLLLDSKNVNAHVDFNERKGEFKSNNGTQVTEFPKNKYICFVDQFNWLMDSDEMELEKGSAADIDISTDLDLAGSNFYSIHPDQDSLNFAAPKAKFSLKEQIIRCDKVKFLDVADARIFPVDEKVIIHKNADMQEFKDAKIIANFVTKYHTISEATVKVLARQKYEASGNYIYRDKAKNERIIVLDEIRQDTNFQTVAKGNVPMDDEFKLSPQFDFYGNVYLEAASPFLTFDGATRISHGCEQFAKNWLKFRTEIDPEFIQIPVDEDMKDLDGNPIAVGIVKRNPGTSDSLVLYPAFLSSLVSPKDHVLFTAYGVLNYNDDAKEYRIASPEKLVNRAENGNYISLHTESCSMEGDGAFDMHLNLPDLEFKPYGVVNYNMSTKQTTLNISGGMNFFFDKKVMDFIKEDIAGTEGIAGIDVPRTTLEQAVREVAGKEIAENVVADYTIDGEVKKLPKELESTMYLTNLRMKWDNRAMGFVSEPISGIVGLMGDPIFKDFTVRLAIEYSVEGGDRGTKMGYLIELPGGEKPGNFYFMRFERVKKETQMYVITSNKTLAAYMAELKDDKTKQKNFSFELKTSKAAAYLSQFRSLFGE